MLKTPPDVKLSFQFSVTRRSDTKTRKSGSIYSICISCSLITFSLVTRQRKSTCTCSITVVSPFLVRTSFFLLREENRYFSDRTRSLRLLSLFRKLLLFPTPSGFGRRRQCLIALFLLFTRLRLANIKIYLEKQRYFSN